MHFKHKKVNQENLIDSYPEYLCLSKEYKPYTPALLESQCEQLILRESSHSS